MSLLEMAMKLLLCGLFMFMPFAAKAKKIALDITTNIAPKRLPRYHYKEKY